MKKIERFLTLFITMFFIIFSISFITKLVVDSFIFKQRTVVYNYVYIEMLIVVAISLILTIFYQFNNVTILTQILITFASLLTVIYGIGFFSGWFRMSNLLFTILSIVFNIVGLILLTIIIMIRKKRDNELLNEELNKYKEREKHEKN